MFLCCSVVLSVSYIFSGRMELLVYPITWPVLITTSQSSVNDVSACSRAVLTPRHTRRMPPRSLIRQAPAAACPASSWLSTAPCLPPLWPLPIRYAHSLYLLQRCPQLMHACNQLKILVGNWAQPVLPSCSWLQELQLLDLQYLRQALQVLPR